MIKSILSSIKNSSKKSDKLLAILLDPDKTSLKEIPSITKKIETFSKFSDKCGAPHLLQMVTFMDISAVSEPILIK